MSYWVNVKTVPPSKHKEVLLHYLGGTILIGCRFTFGYLHENIYGKVTHWMHLPGPPA